jgi:hypothetical protein
MSPRLNGGPAFPGESFDGYASVGGVVKHSGMTLRDYFAGDSLIAFMSSDRYIRGLDDAAARSGVEFKSALAQQVYEMADAMLEARGRL